MPIQLKYDGYVPENLHVQKDFIVVHVIIIICCIAQHDDEERKETWSTMESEDKEKLGQPPNHARTPQNSLPNFTTG